MATHAPLLVSTWEDGLFVIDAGARQHELAGVGVRGLTPDGRGGVLAVVAGHALRRRASTGAWSTLAEADVGLACAVAVGDAVYVGTEDAQVLRLVGSKLEPLPAFGHVEGRETWVAGGALVDGRWLGPPLGVRSIAATADGALLANVHVGGIPRSTDAGESWQPTIDVGSDVHEVRAHPSRPEIVVAAAAAGLCTSRDGGATWTLTDAGLHASYCAAVAFAGDAGQDVLVSASDGHFAEQGRLYRRPVDSDEAPSPVAGLPEWTQGIVDTHGIATRGALTAFADHGGNVWTSADAGATWSRAASGLPAPSAVCLP